MYRLSQSDIYAIACEVARQLPVQDEALTPEAVAEMLGKTREAVVADAKRGNIPAHKRGQRWWFSKNELVRFLTVDEI
jgi:excisionase family DNA binding protein